MRRKNKRGISGVVATVLIVLITIAAVAVIAGFVIPFTKDSLKKSTECIALRDALKFDDSFGYNCYKDGSNALSIRASNDDVINEISSIALVFSSEDNSEKIEIISNGKEIINENGKLTMLDSSKDIKLIGKGEIATYVYQSADSELFNKVEVYPILASGRICDMSDSIELKVCRDDIEIS